MKRARLQKTATIVALLTSFTPVFGQTSDANLDRALKDLGAETIREIKTDICLPATSEEYESMGKHAILMLKSYSAIATELPLRSVYVIYTDVRIPLQRILILKKKNDADSSRTLQVSFYLLPIQFMKSDAQVLADFNGERKGFGFTQFTAKDGLDGEAPAFARLDEYNNPFDPDMTVVQQVLVREYPDYFR